MRFVRTSRALFVLGLVASAATLWSGCSPKKQTELVPGVSTQVRVPKELKSIRVDAAVEGQNVFCGVYDVIDGIAKLPKTLALQSTGKGSQVTVYVTGYQQGSVNDPNATQDQTACAITPVPTVKDAANPDGTSRVLRAAKTNYRTDHVLFLPMPLRFSCFEKSCPIDQNMTCKAGKCVDNTVDENTLPEYNDNLIFGNSATCFSPKACLVDAVLPEIVDEATCTYALWKTPGAPDAGASIPFVTTGNGLNVRAFYDDGSVSEVLDFDKDEGFFIPDPVNAPQIFQLADGLCHPDADTPHRVTGLVASGLCNPKTQYQPLCDEESPSNSDSDASASTDDAGDGTCGPIEILPAPSALVVLMDDTAQMQSFFGANAAKEVLELSLGDPVFQNADLVFAFTPGKSTCAGFVPELSGKTVTASQNDIATLIGGKNPLTLTTDSRALSVALAGAYTTIQTMTAAAVTRKTPYNKTAVLVLGDGDFAPDCGSTQSLAQTRVSGGNISTYAVLIGRQDLQPNPTGMANAGQLQTAGFFNADAKTGGDPNNAANALAQVTQDLASCVYDAPAALKGTGVVTYLNVLPPAEQVRIGFNATCSKTNDTGGWNLESIPGVAGKNRVRICGAECSALQSVLRNTAAFALQSSQAPPAIPIFVESCSDAQPTPISDAGPVPDATVPDAATPVDAGSDAPSDAGADGD